MLFIKAFLSIAILIVMVQLQPHYLNEFGAMVFLGAILVYLWRSK